MQFSENKIMDFSASSSRMKMSVVNFLLLFTIVLYPNYSVSYPLCINDKIPIKLENPLKFCPYETKACCNSTEDLQLQKQFQEMNVSDPACASLMKSILCARCDPFSAELFKYDLAVRKGNVPILCNSTDAEGSHKSSPVDFCTKVWDMCGDISLLNSPLAPKRREKADMELSSSPTKLKDLWLSREDFCDAFGGSSDKESLCFNGSPVSFSNIEGPRPPKGVCLEKIGNGIFLMMAPHPDRSNRVFLANQRGKIWLVNVPEEGSNGVLEIDEANPFLDISDRVLFDAKFGFMGMAFHPNFTTNGRFFLSFNCDKLQHQGCSGRCACNSDVNCDPSKLDADSGAQPCQYHMVIAEFTVNGSAEEPSLAKRANPNEVRKILTMGLPLRSGHAGQILFGPADGYLYVMMADGSHSDDPNNFAQMRKYLFGKILRLDIDNIPSAEEINDLSLWGNYSIPQDNPYMDDKTLAPEIWAMGFRNPWHCSFDFERPSYFFCGDSGQDLYEEIDMVVKGGNYGWPDYEGIFPSNSTKPPKGNTSSNSTDFIFPVLGYSHSEINTDVASSSVSGGYFYRSMTDPCLYGRYLYTDLYVAKAWVATESPEHSGNFSTAIVPFLCAHDSPLNCSFVGKSLTPALGYIFLSAEDNRKDLHILTSTGVYRIVRPSRCSLECSMENVSTYVPDKSGSSFPVLETIRRHIYHHYMLLIFLVNYTAFSLVKYL